MNLNALQGLKGSELIQELMYEVKGRDYTPEGRVWDNANSNMRLMLWNLANLNTLQHNTKFKQEWLKLPNDVKAELRGAIHELHKFVRRSDIVFGGVE